MAPSFEQYIETLLSIEAIKRLKARYCRYADLQDWANWINLFTEDAELDLRNAFQVDTANVIADDYDDKYSATGLQIGKKNIDYWVNNSENIVISSSHHCHLPEIDVTSAATATGIWALEDRLYFKPGLPMKSSAGYGYYHETYERVSGEWLIKTLRVSRLQVNIVN